MFFGLSCPMAHHYYLRYEGILMGTIAQYQKDSSPWSDVSDRVGTYVQRNDVVVLFDGIKTYTFFHGKNKTVFNPYFDTKDVKEMKECD